MTPEYDVNVPIDTPDDWVMCPRCRFPMTRLDDYEISPSSEFPAIEFDWFIFFLFGWTIFVVKWAYAMMGYSSKKAKLASLKRTILRNLPGTLVCPKCLEVQRRL